MTSKPSTQLHWVKSSYSSNEGPECVEVAASPGTVHVRDSKDPEGTALTFPADAWASFLGYAATHVPSPV